MVGNTFQLISFHLFNFPLFYFEGSFFSGYNQMYRIQIENNGWTDCVYVSSLRHILLLSTMGVCSTLQGERQPWIKGPSTDSAEPEQLKERPRGVSCHRCWRSGQSPVLPGVPLR